MVASDLSNYDEDGACMLSYFVLQLYSVTQKILASGRCQPKMCHYTSPSGDRYSRFFDCQARQTFCNKVVIKDAATP